jgi:hypothetical protein
MAGMWGRREICRSEGKSPLGRPRHRWEDNIRMDHKEIRWWGVDWIYSGMWWAYVNMVMNIQVP